MVDITTLFPFDPSLGYLGLLLASFLGSVVLFAPLPFFFILATMSLDPEFNGHLLALSSAAGATAGKMVIFYGSYYGRKMLTEKTKQRMRPLQRVVERYGWSAAFIAAATPIPDDLVYIPLGLSRYNPLRFLTATFAGKLVMTEAIAWGTIAGFSSSIQVLLKEITDPTAVYVSVIVLTIATGAIIYLTLKIDWTKPIGRFFPWAIEDDKDSEK